MSGFGCGRCVECDGGRGYQFCVSPRGINYVPPNPWPTIRHAYDEMRAQRDALAEALRNTLRAAEGFMASVRADTKTAYPWEPWEHESEKARAALAKVTP